MRSKALAVWSVLLLLIIAGEHFTSLAANEAGNATDCSRSEPSGDAMKEAGLKATLVAVQQVEQAIPGWRSSARLYRVLGISIALLGLIMSGLSRLTKDSPAQEGSENARAPRNRAAVAANVVFALGLIVSGLTTWLQQGFATDRKGYLKAADDAVVKMCEIQTQISLFRSKEFQSFDQELNFIRDNITPLTNQLQSIKGPLLAWGSQGMPSPVVYAQSGAPNAISSTGGGECNLLGQAQEMARTQALDLAAHRLARDPRLKLDARNLPPLDAAILRSYVDRYGLRSEMELPTKSKGYRSFLTMIRLDATFSDPGVVTAFLDQARKKPPALLTPDRFDALRLEQRRRAGKPDAGSFIEQTAAIPDSGGVITLKAPNSNDGWFVFRFKFIKDSGGRIIGTVLEGIDIVKNGSTGSARWSFSVLNKGQEIFQLPEQRWDSGGRPTRCLLDSKDSHVTEKVNGMVELTVVGLKSNPPSAR